LDLQAISDVRRRRIPTGCAFRRVARQRANSLQLLSRLGAVEEVVLPKQRPGASYNYHLFPVLLRDRNERTAVMAAMWSKFVDTSMIYSKVVRECRRFG
jgi:dTDP-4-amino-4,6-dideoxygalactose transaminase